MANSSFRDPSGIVYSHNNKIYRQINTSYKEQYDYLINSGLYSKLVNNKLLIPHQEVRSSIEILGIKKVAEQIPQASSEMGFSNSIYKFIKPVVIPFISYAYEWSFSQLKDAALATLAVQKIALEHNMTLKDASSYNIQFFNGRPIFIDTLSFEMCKEDEPWVAYRQFCSHFLAPLLLMSYTHIELNKLLQIYIDGIPLDLASSMLPKSTWLNLPILIHIHTHAKMQKGFGAKKVINKKHLFGKSALVSLINHLESVVLSTQQRTKTSRWNSYYQDNNNYSAQAFNDKKRIVVDYIEKVKPKSVWDFGANTGIFAQLSAIKNILTVSFDNDPLAVETSYLMCKKQGYSDCLPLVLDLSSPTPSIGWENNERMSLYERGPVDMVLALALIHHLAISNNTPFNIISHLLSRLCKYTIVEFVPKEDSQVQKLLNNRNDIFNNYTPECFEIDFGRYFTIQEKQKIKGSSRTLYLMRNKSRI